MATNLEGALLAERYQVHTRLAAGGMSVVYRAWDTHLCRPVAIKALRSDSPGSSAEIARFRREAHAAALLQSPYIVESYDFFRQDRRYFMAMEFVEGPHLKQYILARGKLAPVDALLIAEQVCLGLEEAHAHGFLHRDIKPQNILLDSSGNAKLADFGIVHIAAAHHLTSEGIVLGTADYVSPEQARGLELQPTSDLYSLGVVLFEMLSGVLPFSGTSALAVAMQHATVPPPPLRTLVPELSRDIEWMVNRSLAKDPAHRFQSAYHMAATLRAEREKLLFRPGEVNQACDQPFARPTSYYGLANRPDWRRLADQLRKSAGLTRLGYTSALGCEGDSRHRLAEVGIGLATTPARIHRQELPWTPMFLLLCLLALLVCCIVFFHVLR